MPTKKTSAASFPVLARFSLDALRAHLGVTFDAKAASKCNDYCPLCGRKLKDTDQRGLRFIDGGLDTVVEAEYETTEEEKGGEMGHQALGSACAKKVAKAIGPGAAVRFFG